MTEKCGCEIEINRLDANDSVIVFCPLHTAAEKMQAALEMVRKRWSFSNSQQFTHTWHDWADCKPVVDDALAASEGRQP